MTVRYQNTFRDVMAFCFYHYLRSPVVLGFYGVGFALVSLPLLLEIPKDQGTAARIAMFLTMEAFVFAILAPVFALSIVLSMISRRNKTLLTEHIITLGQDAIMTETPYVKSEQKWAIVQKLARTRRYIFIYVAQYSAHVIPRRAFRDDPEWDAFYEFCKQRARPT